MDLTTAAVIDQAIRSLVQRCEISTPAAAAALFDASAELRLSVVDVAEMLVAHEHRTRPARQPCQGHGAGRQPELSLVVADDPGPSTEPGWAMRKHADQGSTPATRGTPLAPTLHAVVEVQPGTVLEFSRREAQVLSLITQGLTNHEIADQMYLSVNSVKTYIRTCYRKIGAHRRPDAILWGIDHGFGRTSHQTA